MNTFHKVTTLTEFILKEERQYKKATGSFTLLLTYIENASKIINSHVRKVGLIDILGYTGKKNAYGDDVKRLDEYSNEVLVDILKESGLVYCIGSEELAEPIMHAESGEYMVFIDPLDGSQNIDLNLPIGTIFSIYHKDKNILQPGSKQVAAGYILYSSATMFIYSSGHGVNGFTLDPSIGSFLLSHPDIKIPKSGKTYTINEAYDWGDDIKKYLTHLKATKHGSRHTAAAVAEIHRILLEGGVFLSPSKPEAPSGKLRLVYEVNPLSFLIEQAGGICDSSGQEPLDIIPKSHDQKAPIVFGGPEEMKLYRQLVKS